MKNGYVQLCVLVIVITGMHTVKIIRNLPAKTQVQPSKNVKNVYQVSTSDSVTTTVKNRNLNLSFLPGLWNIVLK